jgi:hypothetical protein
MGGYAPIGQDFPSPPFDAVLYQRVPAEMGRVYSVSAWMISLCGGSAMPSDCPAGNYITKMVGVDPTGGTDPTAATVAWQEDRRPHYESWWVDFSPVVQPRGDAFTIFLRAQSPFPHHGNHVFADGVKVVAAPRVRFTQVAASDGAITVGWTGDMGPDIRAIEAGNYRLYYLVQRRVNGGAWQDWQTGQDSGSAVLPTPAACRDMQYEFRARAWAQQPHGEPGAWPPHRFEGPWVTSALVTTPAALACPYRAFLPGIY